MPYRNNPVATKYLVWKILGLISEAEREYRHAAAEVERFSTDPNLDAAAQEELRKAAQTFRELAEGQTQDRAKVAQMAESLGITKGSAPPAASPSGPRGEPIRKNQ